MVKWLIILLVAACGGTDIKPMPPPPIVDQPHLSVPRADRKCKTDVPEPPLPYTLSKVQDLLNAYDAKLDECAGKVDKLVNRIDRFNKNGNP
jgi:hypothetical protein